MLGRRGMKFIITRATKGSRGRGRVHCPWAETTQPSWGGCIPFITELHHLYREHRAGEFGVATSLLCFDTRNPPTWHVNLNRESTRWLNAKITTESKIYEERVWEKQLRELIYAKHKSVVKYFTWWIISADSEKEAVKTENINLIYETPHGRISKKQLWKLKWQILTLLQLGSILARSLSMWFYSFLKYCYWVVNEYDDFNEY